MIFLFNERKKYFKKFGLGLGVRTNLLVIDSYPITYTISYQLIKKNIL